jgi:hypothetical protein
MPSAPKLVVTASGTVLQSWVRGAQNRLDLPTLTAYAPGFVEALTQHPAIALTIVADRWIDSDMTTHVVLGRRGGVRVACAGLRSLGTKGQRPRAEFIAHWGESPFDALKLGNDIEGHVNTFASRHNIGDVTCFSLPRMFEGGRRVDEEFWTFEDQFGAHGGIGGEQAQPFVLTSPEDTPAPAQLASTATMYSWLEGLAPPR